jgi:hypothetical protein
LAVWIVEPIPAKSEAADVSASRETTTYDTARPPN